MAARRLTMAVMLLAAASCTGHPEIAVRPQASAFAAGQHSAIYRVTEARAHFAMGNIALAAEGFRRALREDARSVDALNGLGACYDRMGRFDLSRSQYERALAIAPDDLRLYANLATSLALQGKHADAADVRRELASRQAGETVAAVALDKVEVSRPSLALEEPPSNSVSVALAPVSSPPQSAILDDKSPDGPELERIGLAEVMLITRPRSERIMARQASGTSSDKIAAKPTVTLLNAARVSRLAATTRSRLRQLGWQSVAIGDAPSTQATSSISYPKGRRHEAWKLARQLGVTLQAHGVEGGRGLVVRLGRDVAQRQART